MKDKNCAGTTEQTCCDDERLFPEFSPASFDDWYKEAVASLKGAPYEKKVITKTYEGIDLQPMYWAQALEGVPHIGSLPGFPSYVRGTEPSGYVLKPWDICQEIANPTPEEFNEAARYALARGQNAVKLVLASHSRLGKDPDEDALSEIREDGFSLSMVEDLLKAFRGIDLTTVPLTVYAGASAFPFMALFAAFLEQQKAKASDLRGCIGADPLAELALNGSLPLPLSAAYDMMACLGKWTAENAPHIQTILVHGCPYHDAGANAVQELAFAIATGAEYIREMILRDVSADSIARQVRFVFSLGPNFFMEIAKLRAARLIWGQVVQAFGGSGDACKMTIHGRTSSRTKTAIDPYVNMLRNTTEAFSGAMGGVDSMHVCPFDEPVRPAGEFSQRVSRNLQIILREEAHFTHPIDACGGSWYVEKLTDTVARAAWKLFQEVEKLGGMHRALAAGMPQAAVAEIAAQRTKNIDSRRDVLVGINMYPNLREMPLAPSTTDLKALRTKLAARVQALRLQTDMFRLYDHLGTLAIALNRGEDNVMEHAIKAAAGGATLGDIWSVLANGNEAGPPVRPLEIHRVSERFEGLRKSAAEILEETGNRPRVFLAGVGALASFKPRADFSSALFEVGGFEVLTEPDLSGVEEAVRAAVASPARIIAVCSTDQAYPELIPPLARAIKEARPDVTLLVAGRPPAEQESSYREAGVDDFFYMGMNVFKMLSALQQRS